MILSCVGGHVEISEARRKQQMEAKQSKIQKKVVPSTNTINVRCCSVVFNGRFVVFVVLAEKRVYG